MLIAVVFVPGMVQSEAAHMPKQSAGAPPSTVVDARGTTASPLVVEVRPIRESSEQIDRDKANQRERAASDEATMSINQQLVRIGTWQLVVFALQLLVFGYQAFKLRQTVDAAAEQAADTKRSIAEAARAATAMEAVAASTAASAFAASDAVGIQRDVFSKMLRAYLTAGFGACVPQDKATKWRYEVRMLIENTGNTPAHNIKFASRLRIMPFPLPADTDLSLPIGEGDAAGYLNSRQSIFSRAWLDDMISDTDIAEVQSGDSRRLYVYGFVLYKDIFGVDRRTNFCQAVRWDVKGIPSTENARWHNDAT